MTPDQYLNKFREDSQAIINMYAISYDNQYFKKNSDTAKEFLEKYKKEFAKKIDDIRSDIFIESNTNMDLNQKLITEEIAISIQFEHAINGLSNDIPGGFAPGF